ncbi:MAG TPA: DinB family protein [Candidatus Limnocylindria bacterium]|nr:DinB family protein [Candidatus Limnocylindria bacterium]
MSASVDALIARMSEAERRLAEHADAPVPDGLTAPDPTTDERWEAGQVWAHIAEFPPFWLAEARRVASLPTNEPVPFGRVKTDIGRLENIERERHTAPAALLERVRASLAEVTDATRAFSPEEWNRRGLHPTRGEMTVQSIVERFIVDHLEEHADQLDSLRGSLST